MLHYGTSNWSDAKQIAKCEKSSLGDTSTKCQFTKILCANAAGPGVAQVIVYRKLTKNDVTSKLSVGDREIMDCDANQDQPFCCRIVVSNKH